MLLLCGTLLDGYGQLWALPQQLEHTPSHHQLLVPAAIF